MFKKFLKDETGLELSEYAVAAALVALAAVAAFQLLGTNIGARNNTLANTIKYVQEVKLPLPGGAPREALTARVPRHLSCNSSKHRAGLKWLLQPPQCFSFS